MSDPLTLATIALTTANAVSQANSAREQGDEQAALAERQAQTVARETERRAADLRRQNAALLARRRVHYGKGGIVLSGTPLDLLADAAAENELAVRDVLYQGDNAATDLKLRGAASRRRGRDTQRRGLLAAGTGLLGSL